jgi:hypothetical protein
VWGCPHSTKLNPAAGADGPEGTGEPEPADADAAGESEATGEPETAVPPPTDPSVTQSIRSDAAPAPVKEPARLAVRVTSRWPPGSATWATTQAKKPSLAGVTKSG